MIAKDYRILRGKGVVEITVTDKPRYKRPSFDPTTGNVSQERNDVVDTIALSARRTELVNEIKDIDAFLRDVGLALDENAAELMEDKDIP